MSILCEPREPSMVPSPRRKLPNSGSVDCFNSQEKREARQIADGLDPAYIPEIRYPSLIRELIFLRSEVESDNLPRKMENIERALDHMQSSAAKFHINKEKLKGSASISSIPLQTGKISLLSSALNGYSLKDLTPSMVKILCASIRRTKINAEENRDNFIKEQAENAMSRVLNDYCSEELRMNIMEEENQLSDQLRKARCKLQAKNDEWDQKIKELETQFRNQINQLDAENDALAEKYEQELSDTKCKPSIEVRKLRQMAKDMKTASNENDSVVYEEAADRLYQIEKQEFIRKSTLDIIQKRSRALTSTKRLKDSATSVFQKNYNSLIRNKQSDTAVLKQKVDSLELKLYGRDTSSDKMTLSKKSANGIKQMNNSLPDLLTNIVQKPKCERTPRPYAKRRHSIDTVYFDETDLPDSLLSM